MCGIFGWHFLRGNGLTNAQRQAFVIALAIQNVKRGDKSWGLHLLGRRGGTKTFKGLGKIGCAPELGLAAQSPAGFGHTRHPTTGDVTVANAHPFAYKGIVMAHNGVIYNHGDLVRGGHAAAVDSEHLVHALAGDLPFSEIKGYGSIEWTREDHKGQILLCRMRGGSLSVYGLTVGKRRVGVVWSSDEDHLLAALECAGIENIFEYKAMPEGEVFSVYDGQLRHTTEAKIELSEGFGRSWDDDGWDARAMARYYNWRDRQTSGTSSLTGTSGRMINICPSCYGELLPSGWCQNCREIKHPWRAPRYEAPKPEKLEETKPEATTYTVELETREDRDKQIEDMARDLGLTFDPEFNVYRDSNGDAILKSEIEDVVRWLEEADEQAKADSLGEKPDNVIYLPSGSES